MINQKILDAANVGFANTQEEARIAAVNARREHSAALVQADADVAHAEQVEATTRRHLADETVHDWEADTYSKDRFRARLDHQVAQHLLKAAKVQRERARLDAAQAALIAAADVYRTVGHELVRHPENPWDMYEG